MGCGKRRVFTAEPKAEVVRLVQRGGRSIGQVAQDLDLTESALRRWVEQAEIDAGRGREGALTSAEREELSQPSTESGQRHFESTYGRDESGVRRTA